MNVEFNVVLTENEADAISQYLKRVGLHDFRGLAKSDEEAYLMQVAAEKVRKSLAEKGYAPR